MSERNLRIRLGIFVVVTLLLLGLLILLFGSLPSLLVTRNYYTVIFDDAPGVNQGTPVRRSGVRIGEVTDVVLDDVNDKVRVKIAIDPKYTLRRSERPTIITGFLGNDTSINFIPVEVKPGEQPDRTEIKPGAEIEGFRQVTVNTLLARASDVVPTTQEVLNDMRKSLKRFEDMAPLAEETMKEYRDLARDIRGTVPDLRKTNDEVRELSKSLRDSLPDFRRSAEDLAATARTYTRLGERLDNLLQNNQEKITKGIDAFNDVMQRAANVLSDENQRNATALLKNASAASNHIDEIARNTADITREGKTTVRRLNDSLVRAEDVLNNAQKVTKPFADRSDTIARNFEEVLVRLNRTLIDTNSLIRAVGQSDGTLNRLLTDPSLYNRLDETLCGIQKAMPRIDRILQDFEVFADKVARHPELIGVRGAIRPDAGIK